MRMMALLANLLGSGMALAQSVCMATADPAQDPGQTCVYRNANLALPPATHDRIVFFGDSITRNWQADRDFFGGDRIGRGISGQTTTQMRARFAADVIALHPRIVHIMGGTNDIAGNGGPVTLEMIEANLRAMAEKARAHGIRVIFGAVLPAARFPWRPDIDPKPRIRALNGWLRTYARRHKGVYADYHGALDDGHESLSREISTDGVHPNAAGYALMRPVAEAAIGQAWEMTAP
jgi:lysophospholipase L1-like esterase